MAFIWAYICSILIVHSNHSLCPSISKFPDPICSGVYIMNLICSVHQEPSRQKVASIWAYTCSITRVHSYQSLCQSIPKFTDLICSVHQDPTRQKVASVWAYICSIHSNLNQLPCSNLLSIWMWKKGFSVKKAKTRPVIVIIWLKT